MRRLIEATLIDAVAVHADHIVEDAVAGAHHRSCPELIGKAHTRSKIVAIAAPESAGLPGAGKQQSSCCLKARRSHLWDRVSGVVGACLGRHGVRRLKIESADAPVKPVRDRTLIFPPQPGVQCQPARNTPVVLVVTDLAVALVAVLVACTVAPEARAPVGSIARPIIVALDSCAKHGPT